MNGKIIVIILVLAAFAAGVIIGPRLGHAPSDDAPSEEKDSGEKKILYWVAPMDANFRKDGPGKSPMGMDLVPVYADEQQGSGSEVVISPEVIQNLGVRTSVAERSKLWRKISTVGFVDYDE